MVSKEHLKNILFKFTAYAAQAKITNDATKRKDLHEMITKPLREGILPCLDLVPTFSDLRKKLPLIVWGWARAALVQSRQKMKQ